LMLTVVTNTFNGNNAKKKWLRKKNKGIQSLVILT
jgi:hypothetical protein